MNTFKENRSFMLVRATVGGSEPRPKSLLVFLYIINMFRLMMSVTNSNQRRWSNLPLDVSVHAET